jgi:hypothetical protein
VFIQSIVSDLFICQQVLCNKMASYMSRGQKMALMSKVRKLEDSSSFVDDWINNTRFEVCMVLSYLGR